MLFFFVVINKLVETICLFIFPHKEKFQNISVRKFCSNDVKKRYICIPAHSFLQPIYISQMSIIFTLSLLLLQILCYKVQL